MSSRQSLGGLPPGCTDDDVERGQSFGEPVLLDLECADCGWFRLAMDEEVAPWSCPECDGTVIATDATPMIDPDERWDNRENER